MVVAAMLPSGEISVGFVSGKLGNITQVWANLGPPGISESTQKPWGRSVRVQRMMAHGTLRDVLGSA
jgi:hypothetical protein